MSRINNPESCICCARRSDGLAIGQPHRLGWYCFECGPITAWSAFQMKNLDRVEQRAVEKVAEMAGEGDLTIREAELPAFIAWCVKEFANAMREAISNGKH